MTRTLSTLTDAERQRMDVGWLRLAKVVLWRDRYGASPSSLTLYLSDATRYLPVDGGGTREYLGLVQQWGTVGDSLEAEKPETAPSSADLVISDGMSIAAGGVMADRFSALFREGANTSGYDPGGAQVSIAWMPPTGTLGIDDVTIFVGTADAPDPMVDSETVTLKCTSDEVAATIPLEPTIAGPGTFAMYVWVIHESHEVEVHDGDVEDLCTLTSSGSTTESNVLASIGSSVVLDYQSKDTPVGAQPATEGGNINRTDTLWLYVPDGVSITDLRITLSAMSVTGTVGEVRVHGAVTGWGRTPPSLADIQADPCIMLPLTLDSVGIIGDGVSDPSPALYTLTLDSGGVASPALFRFLPTNATAITFDTLGEVTATLGPIAVVTL